MELGKRIREARKKQRLSAEDLALKLGLKKENIYKWERGSKPSDPEEYNIIMRWLNNLENVPHETNNNHYTRMPKIESDPIKEGITFIPISAQAGYAKRIIEPMFRSSLQKIFIPGMPYRGENFRIWEVEGNSMEPTFKEGFFVLSERVEPPFDRIKEHYAYVVVTQDDVFLKRLKKSKTMENAWAAISDNEELYPPFLIPIEEVKELWLIKRKMDWEMSPPKRFDVNI